MWTDLKYNYFCLLKSNRVSTYLVATPVPVKKYKKQQAGRILIAFNARIRNKSTQALAAVSARVRRRPRVKEQGMNHRLIFSINTKSARDTARSVHTDKNKYLTGCATGVVQTSVGWLLTLIYSGAVFSGTQARSFVCAAAALAFFSSSRNKQRARAAESPRTHADVLIY